MGLRRGRGTYNDFTSGNCAPVESHLSRRGTSESRVRSKAEDGGRPMPDKQQILRQRRGGVDCEPVCCNVRPMVPNIHRRTTGSSRDIVIS